jgi:hypothetical protein
MSDVLGIKTSHDRRTKTDGFSDVQSLRRVMIEKSNIRSMLHHLTPFMPKILFLAALEIYLLPQTDSNTIFSIKAPPH